MIRMAARNQYGRTGGNYRRGPRCVCGRLAAISLRGHGLCAHAWRLRRYWLGESERARRLWEGSR
jgi:hypothetical protein